MSIYTPTVRVEVAFGLGPFDTVGGGDWVDISSSVQSISVYRGRPSEFQGFGPSTCTIELLSDDREFDPLNTSGTYYGDLVADVPVRVVATVSAVDYPIWRGFVDGWPARYGASGAFTETRVSCTDAFKLLSERPLPDTFELFLDGFGRPTTRYRCDSVFDRKVVNDGDRGRDAKILTPVDVVAPLTPTSFGAVSISEQLPPTDQRVSALSAPIVWDDYDNPLPGTAWTFHCVAQFPKIGDRALIRTTTRDDVGSVLLGITFGSSSGRQFPWYAVGHTAGTAVGSTQDDISDGLPHRFVWTRDYTRVRVFVDGQLSLQTDHLTAVDARDCEGGAAQYGMSAVGDGTITPETVVDQIMAWDYALSIEEVAELDDQEILGYSTLRTTGEAVGDLLDLVGWPAALRDIESGEMTVNLPVNPVGQSALSLLQEVARAEGGRLFVGPDGKIVFHSRGRALNTTVENTVQYTFSDTAGADASALDGTLTITVDDRGVWDAAKITRANGVPQTSVASGVTYPARTFEASGLILSSDQQAKSLADWTVFRYSTPQARSDEWAVHPELVAADWADILTLDIGHRVKIDMTPGGVGSAIELEQHLELIRHDIEPGRWAVTLNGSPPDPNIGNYFLWDTAESADDYQGWAASVTPPPDGGAWG